MGVLFGQWAHLPQRFRWVVTKKDEERKFKYMKDQLEEKNIIPKAGKTKDCVSMDVPNESKDNSSNDDTMADELERVQIRYDPWFLFGVVQG